MAMFNRFLYVYQRVFDDIWVQKLLKDAEG
jgi:hypothetical protein